MSLFDWSVAVSMFFRLFGDESFENESLQTEHYPPIRVRQMMANTTAFTFIGERWDKDIIHRGGGMAMAGGQSEIEIAFPSMTGAPISVTGLGQSWDGS